MWNFSKKGLLISKVFFLKFLAILFALILLSGCQSELYSNLNERQVNEMIMVLGEDGIDASRTKIEDGIFSLTIDRSDFVRAIAVLSARGLPSNSYQSLGDVFKSDKIVSTPFEERARFMYALNQELSQSITQIDGIVSSRVHITIPEETPFAEEKRFARASIFIYHAPSVDVSIHIPVIKNLVTRSVDGLLYENVTVALFSSQSEKKSQNAVDAPKKPNGFTSFLVFLIISGIAFFVINKFVLKPKNKAQDIEPVDKENVEKP